MEESSANSLTDDDEERRHAGNSENVDVVEFQQLREEIQNRTKLQGSVVALQLAALGAALSVFDKFSDGLLAIAFVGCLLWLIWIDHQSQIYKLAAYLELVLAPRLRARNRNALGWEQFARFIDGPKRSRVFGKLHAWLDTKSIATFIALLFGFTPVLLVAVWFATEWDTLCHSGPRCRVSRGTILLVASCAFWVFTILKYVTLRRMLIGINAIIEDHDPVTAVHWRPQTHESGSGKSEGPAKPTTSLGHHEQ